MEYKVKWVNTSYNGKIEETLIVQISKLWINFGTLTKTPSGFSFAGDYVNLGYRCVEEEDFLIAKKEILDKLKNEWCDRQIDFFTRIKEAIIENNEISDIKPI